MKLTGIRMLDDDQLELLETQLARQEDQMAGRSAAAATRAAILIGVSAVLGGTELVTSSGVPWLSAASLFLYLAAAILGLLATRSRLQREPFLETMVPKYFEYSTITLRRALLLSRLDAHAESRKQINQRHNLLVVGFVALLAAWISSASSTTYAFFQPDPDKPVRIEIVEENAK